MQKNPQSPDLPIWFDGKNINEALFCEEFLQAHRIIFTNRAFFTPDGRVPDDLSLRGGRHAVCSVIADPIHCFTGQIQTLSVFLDDLHDADTLFCMIKSGKSGRPQDLIQRFFSGVTKGCVPQVMTQSNGFCQVFVHTQRFGNGTSNLRYFQCMRQTRAVMVTLRFQKDLCLVLQSAEGFTVQNTVTVTLVARADIVLFRSVQSSHGAVRMGSFGIKDLIFSFFHLFTYRHYFLLKKSILQQLFRGHSIKSTKLPFLSSAFLFGRPSSVSG